MKLVLSALASLWLFPVAASPALTNHLLAFYPFQKNGADGRGKNSSFLLTNAPFTQGVVYINGTYEPNGHFVNYLSTAPLEGLRYESFTVSLDFCPDPKARKRKELSLPEAFLNSITHGAFGTWVGYGNNDERNILTGGQSYRWIGFHRDGNRLTLTLNNQQFTHQFKNTKVHANRWHNLICSVDLNKRQIQTFLDGRKLEIINLPYDFRLEVVNSPDAYRDREFTFANYSSGSVYRGYAANLKVFDRALSAEEMALLRPGLMAGLPTFPAHTAMFIFVLLGIVVCLGLALFLLLGRGLKPEVRVEQVNRL